VLGTQAVTVNDVAPSASLSGAGAVDEGSVYALGIGAILDPGADTVSAYRIVWGDETTPGSYQSVSAAQLALNGGVVTHTYADGAASYNVQVFAQNDDGLFALGSHAVDVLNVAPTVDASGAASATVGVAYTLSLANYVDPGQDTLLPNGIVVDWGDGTQSTASSLGDLTHTYLAASTPTLTVSLADEDGSYANVASLGLTVGLPTPTLSLAAQAAGTVNEGSAFTRSIAFSDGEDSNGDGWNYTVQWNDGVVQSGTTTVQHFDLNRTAADGNATLTATITVSDTGGADSDSTSLQLGVLNVAPTASLSGPATVDEGGVYTLTVGAILDPGTDTRSGYTIAWGDGSTDAFTPAQWATAAGNFTHTYADGASAPTITVSTTDEDGTTVLGTQAVTVANVAPSLVLDGAASTLEGATYQLTLTGSDAAGSADPLAYSIAWGDGSTQTVLAADLPASGIVSHVFTDDEDGPANATARQVTVTVTDGDGGSTEVSKTVTVSNVAPTIEASGAASTTTGLAYTLSLAHYLDPGQDTLLPDGILINWGDGSTSTASAVGDITHTYSAAGTPTILVSLADEDGSYANVASLGLTVGLPTPTLSLAAQAAGTVNEGSAFTRSIAFSDGEDSNGDGWNYTVQWNDGVVQSGTTTVQHFDLNRTAADGNATLTATITVSDTGGADSDSTSLQLGVLNVAPTASLSGPATVDEGGVYTLTVGAITDPGADTRSGYTIAWGDGSTDALTPADWAAAAGNFTHTYADGASAPTITVSTTDEDGTTVLGTQAVTVANVAPSLVLDGAASTLEGATYQLTLTGSDVAGSADPLAYSIAWGDGSTQTVLAADLPASGIVSHVFTDDEDGPANATARQVTVTVTDGDGGSTEVSKTVTVSNVAPTASLSGPATVDEGSVYTLTVGAILDPGTDTRSGYSIAWGDGSTDTLSPAQWAAAAGNFTHTYADGASYPDHHRQHHRRRRHHGARHPGRHGERCRPERSCLERRRQHGRTRASYLLTLGIGSHS
jgi:hypothetical protein